MTYPHLFSPAGVGAKTSPNRLVSQAMEGNDGCVLFNDYYRGLFRDPDKGGA